MESGLSAGTGCSGAPHVKVVEGRCFDYVISALLLVAIAVPSITVVVVVATEWQAAPSQRGWLILGFGFYIVASLRYLGSLLVKSCEQILYLRVEVRRFAAHTLFDAITDAVALEAEKMGGTCSFDQEAVQEHDRLTGKMAVKFRFWAERRLPRGAYAVRSVDARARPVVCAALSSSHRRLGSIRADTGEAKQTPIRERVVVSAERR